MSYKGVVTGVNRKDGIGKNGKPYTLFSAKVDTSDRYLNFKFKDPGLNKEMSSSSRGLRRGIGAST